ncbi:MAG: hypothetical protein PHV59_09275 [Victivallales bacterium]|nr:hypothetical protein [Victivallales bacterium]
MKTKGFKSPAYFAYRSFRPEYATMKRFREIGVDTFGIMFSNGINAGGKPYTAYQPIWNGPGEYDLGMVDRQFEDLFAAVPDAKVICYCDLNPPSWWVRSKQGLFNRYDSYYELGKICSSGVWRSEAIEYMRVLFGRIYERCGERFLAAVFSAGSTTEWFDKSEGEESAYRLHAYRKWRQAHGLDANADIPSRRVRFHFPYGTEGAAEAFQQDCAENPLEPEEIFECSGFFRVPEEDREALGFWKFNNEMIADTVLLFAREARKFLPAQVKLGTTFGYLGYTSHRRMLVSNGHLESEKVFDSPDLDFFIAPAAYVDRSVGGGGGSMIPIASLHARGKRLHQSSDHRTFSMRQPEAFYKALNAVMWKTSAEVVAGIKRETAFNLIEHNSTWWFDMLGGWWDSPEAMDTLAKSKKIWDRFADSETEETAEIIVVTDPENLYYLNDAHRDIGKFNIEPRRSLAHVGAPFLWCVFNDLEKMDLSRVKLVVFLHPFELSQAKRKVLDNFVCRDGRTVLWLYGPGIINDGGWMPENVEKVCGVPFKTPGVSSVERGNYRSVYCYDSALLTPEKLYALALEAGVHLYCDKPRVVYGNSKFLALHTPNAEKLTISFAQPVKQVTELYSGRTENEVSEFSVESVEPETFLLEIRNE